MAAIKVLYVNGGQLDYGGITSFMINYCRHFDSHKIRVDIITHGMDKGPREQEFVDIGCKIYHIPYKSKDYFGNIKSLRKIFRSGKYKIVHSHMDAMNGFVLKQAKICKVPIRISHSHNSQFITNNRFKLLLNKHAKKMIPKYATHLFACSELAGRWLYGNKLFSSGKVTLIKNAVDVNKYFFNEHFRLLKRKELGIKNDQFVIGHIGRFDVQKNQFFLLNIFEHLIKIKPNSKLVFIGEGPLREEIKDEIRKKGLVEKIILLKDREDIHEILSAFDVFVLPSIFEGLPLVLIEAQTAGLPCIVSDNVSAESKIFEGCSFVSIHTNADNWANIINQVGERKYNRSINIKNIQKEGYDIACEAGKLQKLYIKLLN